MAKPVATDTPGLLEMVESTLLEEKVKEVPQVSQVFQVSLETLDTLD